MKLSTARFGQLEIQEEDVYVFPNGIPGFEQHHRFGLIEVEEHKPFSYLQSISSPDLAFVVIDPFIIYPKYEFDLSEDFIQEIQIQSEDQILVRAIVSVHDNLNDATVNLVAPIVLNANERKGKQLILTHGDYSTKHRLLEGSADE
ncbi:MAG: flagellar assembly protein FliW [Candidatus Cohnella colombiensis]|uniref:Flagellar assembly factor FliW n=1 Tax=Candidatus Cohnella colombiensis TaxID=3121368 RepID=A0AA95JBC3_9BACL|nr:MAG: flagellar assembly protein FliW [Cohnella sp.]